MNRKYFVTQELINEIVLINLLGDIMNRPKQNKTFKNQNKKRVSNFNDIEIIFVFN